MTKKTIDWRIVIAGLMALTAIEITALCNGIDGTLLTMVIGVIGLVIGVAVPNPIKR